MYWVGQNHIYTVYIWYFWQGNHQIYGHIRCVYTVLASPSHVQYVCTVLAIRLCELSVCLCVSGKMRAAIIEAPWKFII